MAISERVMPLMTVTEAAATKIKELMSEETDVSVLRVAIQGGGCSGFQYGLGFDRGAVEGDLEFEMHGVQVVVDPFSAPYLQGARGRLRRHDPVVGLRHQQPERRLVLRLRPLLPGGEGDTDASIGGCGSGCSA
jgi:iron-sulfur cluster assembly accessory protein